jgi:hypothetical protein
MCEDEDSAAGLPCKAAARQPAHDYRLAACAPQKPRELASFFSRVPNKNLSLSSRARMRCWARPWCRGRPHSRCRRWCSTATYEIELADFCGPRGATRGREVLVHVPEAHAIGGINGRIGVIAPAPGGMRLRAAAIGHYGFTLPEVI